MFSADAEAKQYSLGCNARPRTLFLWYVRVVMALPLRRSHSLTVLSCDPVITCDSDRNALSVCNYMIIVCRQSAILAVSMQFMADSRKLADGKEMCNTSETATEISIACRLSRSMYTFEVTIKRMQCHIASLECLPQHAAINSHGC